MYRITLKLNTFAEFRYGAKIKMLHRLAIPRFHITVGADSAAKPNEDVVTIDGDTDSADEKPKNTKTDNQLCKLILVVLKITISDYLLFTLNFFPVFQRQIVLLKQPDWQQNILKQQTAPKTVISQANRNYNVCSINGCLSNENVKVLYPFPKCTVNMPAGYQQIERKRRWAWVNSITFKRGTNLYCDSLQVCGRHFQYGQSNV